MSVLFKDKITGIWKRAAANLIYASFPVGSIVAYGGSSDVAAPAGCMYCHGQVLNESDYPDLYAVIGTKFGVGDGSAGSFNLPELRGEFLRGAGMNQHSGQGSGGAVGAHQDASEIMYNSYYATEKKLFVNSSSTRYNYDGRIYHNDGYIGIFSNGTNSPAATGNESAYNYYPRPTNTSVEYIIRVVK